MLVAVAIHYPADGAAAVAGRRSGHARGRHAVAVGAGRDHHRPRRPAHPDRRPHHDADHGRRRPRRRGLAHGADRRPASCRAIRSKASRPPRRPRCASPSTTTTSTSAALCHDSDPAHIVVNDIRKDFAGAEQDIFEVLLDTFEDRRNGFVFATNAAGARADTQIANEGRDVNPNWDAVWWVAGRITPDGLDGRVPHPVQDPAVPARRRPRLGPQLRAPDPAEERSDLLVPGVARVLDRAGVVGRHADRPARPGPGPQHPRQAVRAR